MRTLLACLLLWCSVLSFSGAAQSQPAASSTDANLAASMAARRAQLLHRGVNASMWFAQASDYSPARLRSYTTADDIALMHAMGFDHVRLSIDGDELLRGAPPNGLNAVFVAELDAAVNTMLKDGLRVIVDVHPSDEFKRQLRTDDAAVTRFCATMERACRSLCAERSGARLLRGTERTGVCRRRAVEDRPDAGDCCDPAGCAEPHHHCDGGALLRAHRPACARAGGRCECDLHLP